MPPWEFIFTTTRAIRFGVRSLRLYRFLAHGTNAKFNKLMLKWLFLKYTNRPPLSVSRLVHKMKQGWENKTAVVVGIVTDDGTRRCILKAGGQIMSFDQLAMAASKTHQVYPHFDKTPGTPHPPQPH
ncbi:60S ribosomal protein L18-B, partial [Ophiophagus hannah]